MTLIFGPVPPDGNTPLPWKVFLFGVILGISLLWPRSRNKIRDIVLLLLLSAALTLTAFLLGYFR